LILFILIFGLLKSAASIHACLSSRKLEALSMPEGMQRVGKIKRILENRQCPSYFLTARLNIIASMRDVKGRRYI
jgi:hypothetical protein